MNGTGPYICGHNVLKAHARAYEIYNKEFRSTQNGKVGIVSSCMHFFPINENEKESSKIAFAFNCGWLTHPIFSKDGDYPPIMKKIIRKRSRLEGLQKSRLPIFATHWIKKIRFVNSLYCFFLNFFFILITTS